MCPVRGDDLGRWLARQREASTWAQLSTEQRERLSRLGVRPLEAGPFREGRSRSPQRAHPQARRLSPWAWPATTTPRPCRSGRHGAVHACPTA
ncbi:MULTISPECIES: helicase associated domain-containing protein [Streptomyces]|uniref:helicase associated domain-containing protein n=1 Tax=Streptomyces TaxID=1883 RepID=UPI0036B92BD3